jgi:hypothetical protein
MYRFRSPLGSETTAKHHSSFGEADHGKSEAEEAGKLQNVSGVARYRCASARDLCIAAPDGLEARAPQGVLWDG